MNNTTSGTAYYIPSPSHWPLTGSVALFAMAIGFAMHLNGHAIGWYVLGAGVLILITMLFGWFGTVISESERGLYNADVDRSFRWAMTWFIFSEIMFFAAFFGALFYARVLSVPWLGGASPEFSTNQLLWPNFHAQWPLLSLPDGTNYTQIKEVIPAFGIPAWNTAILLTSGATITWAHWGLVAGKRQQLILGLAATVLLGAIFVVLQIEEYGHAYHELGLTLNSGIYGATFFMLTGFHGFHVTLGAIMLTVVLFRAMSGHFTAEHHFAFEATSWYWHFVDVVWLGLFVFVYWL